MRTRISKWLMAFVVCVLLFTMSDQSAYAAGKTIQVSSSKSTIYVLDNQKNTSQLQVMYGDKNVTRACKYSVNNRKVASVSKSGKITAAKAGKVTVTVKYKKNSKKIKITVKNPKLTVKEKSLQLQKNQTYALKAYANQSAISQKNVIWSSNNKKIATVSKSGVVKGLKAGTAVITGKTKTGKVSCKVTVTKAVSGGNNNNSNSNGNSNSGNDTAENGECKHDGPISQVDRGGKMVWGMTCGCGISFAESNDSLKIHQAEQFANTLTAYKNDFPADYACSRCGGPTPLDTIENPYVEAICMKCGKSLGVTYVYDMHVDNWVVTVDTPKDFEFTENNTTYHVQHYKEKRCTTCGMRIGEYQYYTTTE